MKPRRFAPPSRPFALLAFGEPCRHCGAWIGRHRFFVFRSNETLECGQCHGRNWIQSKSVSTMLASALTGLIPAVVLARLGWKTVAAVYFLLVLLWAGATNGRLRPVDRRNQIHPSE